MSPASDRIKLLKDRALMLKKVRLFFSQRKIFEVDCPILSQKATIDTHIEVMQTSPLGEEIGYLHTSAEYGMKRLLSEGMEDIFQLSHVFRRGEKGSLHNPEFTLIEWYRKGFSFSQMIQETLRLLHLFFGKLPKICKSYRELFLETIHLDPFLAPTSALFSFLEEKKFHLPSDAFSYDRDTLLNLLLTHFIEHSLGKKELFVLTDFPSSQAALAQVEETPFGKVAKRFEIYYKGIELANGYLELSDPLEQKKRFESWNEERRKANKEVFPIDDRLLDSLKKLPACSGVAVGFDRLLLLRHQKKKLSDVLAFSWEDA
jgi:elongation factor P--(R)-beta-lysine ligase